MPERGTLNIEKAHLLLGYEPEFTLEKCFVQHINWYKQFSAQNSEMFGLSNQITK